MVQAPLPDSVFKDVFTHSSVGGYLLSARPEFSILAVNEAFLATTGRSREELLGKPLFVAFPESPHEREGVEALRRSLMHVLQTREPDALPLQRYPIEVAGEGGSQRFWGRSVAKASRGCSVRTALCPTRAYPRGRGLVHAAPRLRPAAPQDTR